MRPIWHGTGTRRNSWRAGDEPGNGGGDFMHDGKGNTYTSAQAIIPDASVKHQPGVPIRKGRAMGTPDVQEL